MSIYFFLLTFLLLLGVFKYCLRAHGYGSSADRFVTYIGAISLFLVAALRSTSVGADTYQYCSHFLKIAGTKLSDFAAYTNGYYGDIEIGYKIYNKLISVFFSSSQSITCFNSLLLIVLIAFVIRRYSDNEWLSLFLYFSFCFYQTALNLTPSSIVSYFMFLLYPLIEEKRWWEFFLLTLLAMTFHTSAIFFIPLYFLSKIKVTPKTIGIVVAAGAIGTVFYAQVLPVIIGIVPTKYAVYISPDVDHKQATVELLVYAVQLAAVIFCLFIAGRKKSLEVVGSNSVACWDFLYETVLYIFSTQVSNFSRGAFLFAPFTIIIIPKILSVIEEKSKRVLATFCIVLFGVLIYVLRILINNVGKTMPYQFFWD